MDLRDPRCAGKTEREPFLRRIFTDDEVHEIRRSPDPERALWLRWAAKEAAFKVVSKLLGSPPPFEHAAFRVSPDPPDPDAGSRGSVRYRNLELPFMLDTAADRIHVTAWEPGTRTPPPRLHRGMHLADELAGTPSAGWREEMVGRFTEREWEAVHGAASAVVRLRARADLARSLEVEESSIEIVCDDGPPGRSLPRVLLDGEECGVDVSLSHHHRLLAWAFVLPAPGAPDPAPGSEELRR